MRLKVGDIIPSFKAKDANGNDFDSQSIVGRKPLVIYFYPKDNTPGCTAEACSFRDQYEDFKDLGAEVIGISSDSVSSHQEFSRQFKLPLFCQTMKKKSKIFLEFLLDCLGYFLDELLMLRIKMESFK